MCKAHHSGNMGMAWTIEALYQLNKFKKSQKLFNVPRDDEKDAANDSNYWKTLAAQCGVGPNDDDDERDP